MPKEILNLLVLDIDNSGLVAHRSRTSRKSPPHLLSEFLVDEAKSPALVNGKYSGFYVCTHRTFEGIQGDGKKNTPSLIQTNIQNFEVIRNFVKKYPRLAHQYSADFSEVEPDDEFTSSFVKNFSAATEQKIIKVSTPGDINYSCGHVYDKFLSQYEKEIMASKKRTEALKKVQDFSISGVWTTYDFDKPLESKEKPREDNIETHHKNQQYIQIAKDAVKRFPDYKVRLVVMDDDKAILTQGLAIIPKQLPKNVTLDFYQLDSFELYDKLAQHLDPKPFIKIGTVSAVEEKSFSFRLRSSLFRKGKKVLPEEITSSESVLSLSK